MSDGQGSTFKGLIIGIVITVGSTIATGWVTRLADGSLYRAAGGRINVTDSGEALAQGGQTLTELPLGKHDFCALSRTMIQSKTGTVGCFVTRNGESWSVSAWRKADDTGSQAQCNAVCVDIK